MRPIRWLAHSYYHTHGRLPAVNSLREVISGLRSSAHASPKRLPTDVRIAASDPTRIYIDLANPTGESVEITPAGWQITRPFEVAFLSARGQLALPTPAANPTTNDERTTTNAFPPPSKNGS
jgi:hypothetical protein